MSIFCLGVNHKTAPVEIRERLAFAENELPDRLGEIGSLPGIEECVILSTCNRVEIYGAGKRIEDAFAQVGQYLIGHFEIDSPGAVDFYRLADEEAARHLFRVASGLDSMVLGETEIFGQVKKAYALARESGSPGRRLNKLFQQSFQIGKLIRSHTRIQQGATSVGSVAVDLAEKIFGNLNGCHVMVIGAGEMSRQTAKSLMSRGARGIMVSNRSFEKAEELAGELKGEAVRFEDWERALRRVDIVISSTAAPHAIVGPEMVKRAVRQRGDRSLFIIDIAVPRDVDPAVNEIENVYLYDIDDLERTAEIARIEREKQIAHCESMIRSHIDEKGIAAMAAESPAGAGGEAMGAEKAALVLGTRGSDLALTQARMVEAALRESDYEGGIEVRIIRTSGDKRPDLKLSEFSQGDQPVLDKGIFTKELEEALVSGEVDFAVHSLKDVPTELDAIFTIAATLERAPIEDVLLTRAPFSELPETGVIATSSVRRARQLVWLRPGIQVVDIRGNVPTRIRKLCENPDWDGILLARAGLERLGILEPGAGQFDFDGTTVHALCLEEEEFLPAAGQGAVAMECLKGNRRAIEALRGINHVETFQRVAVERAFLARLQAGCQTPVGIRTWFDEDGTVLRAQALVFEEENPEAEPRKARAAGKPDDPEAIADQLMGQIHG